VKAIILNSGEGKRLYPLTKDKPKALIKVGDKPILGHQLESLISCNIKKIIITTGPFEDKIKEYVKNNYPNIKVYYVNNPKYHETNYIYSMWLTKELIDDDIILLHGDLVFEKKLLSKLIKDKSPNGVLVNNKINPPEKDFKAIVKDGFVTKIGTHYFGRNAYFCAPIYKFARDSFLRWLLEIESFIKNGSVTHYGEDAYNQISEEIKLRAVYYSNEFCMEIDTFQDLGVAEEYFKNL